MRKTKFANGECYHIYNRGVDKRKVFGNEGDYLRFLESMREFNNSLGDAERKYIKNRNIKPIELKSKSDFETSKSDFKNLKNKPKLWTRNR